MAYIYITRRGPVMHGCNGFNIGTGILVIGEVASYTVESVK